MDAPKPNDPEFRIPISNIGQTGRRTKPRTFLELTIATGRHIGRRQLIELLLDAEGRFFLQDGQVSGLVARLITEERMNLF